MKILLLTFILFSCGKNDVARYNGKVTKGYVFVGEDVEEDISNSMEVEIPNKLLEESKKKLLKQEKMKIISTKEIASSENHEKKKPSDLNDWKAIYSSTCNETNGVREYYYYKKRIESLGGKSVYPYSTSFPNSINGFQKFLRMTGIKHFTANEVSEGAQSILNICRHKNLMPPKNCWPRTALLLLLSEEIRDSIGGYPLGIGSLYRSQCYNRELQKRNVSVAPKSDHLLAKAVDLFYAGKAGRVNIRKKIQSFICKRYWKNPVYTSLRFEDGSVPNISIGIGNTNIHLGIDSPRGRRSWLYKSYPSTDNQLAECFGS